MKVKKKKNGTPIALILETQDEIDKVFAVFNYAPLVDVDKLFKQIHTELLPHRDEISGYKTNSTWNKIDEKFTKTK